MKKILKIILPIFIFFIGLKVNAKGTMFIGNGTVLNQCTGTTCAYPSAGTTNLRFIGDSSNFQVDHKYTFKLNFSATTGMASPTLTDCGLNVNGAYVSPESRNSGRINYECNQGYSRCDSTYASTIVWTATSTLSSVPYFIQCDMTPSGTTYTYTNFIMSISDSNGSVIQAIDNNTDRMIEVNNYNANQNNANRDRNTNKLTDKIQDFMDSVSSGIGNIISNLTTLGQNIVSGISSAINSSVSTISNGLNAITTAIGNGVNSIVNKIGELIGLQVVCDTTYVDKDSILTNNKAFNSSGDIIDASNTGITDYFVLQSDTKISIFNSRYAAGGAFYCFYNGNTLISCSSPQNMLTGDELTIPSNATRVRFTIQSSANRPTYNISNNCQKRGLFGLFNKLFNSNVNDAKSLGSREFDNFTTTNVGLRGLLDTLVTFVNNIFNSTCSPLVLPIPFVDKTVTLPCMSGIYTTYFPTFFYIYQLITTGLIAYRVIINLFHKVHQLEDVNYDKVEVLSL